MPDSTVRPLLRTVALRALEARALAATADGELMGRAAAAIARAAARMLRAMPAGTPVLALAGPGNNGGDALLAALALAAKGHAVRAIALRPDPPRAPDARRAWHRWRDAGLPIAAPDALDALLDDAPLVVDGLFGIGLDRPLPEAAAEIAIRLARRDATVLAVDVPSGLDADTGALVGGADAVAVRAARTVTMIADKPGLRTGAGPAHAGVVEVADLGLAGAGFAIAPDGPGDGGAPACTGVLVDAAAVRGLLAPRAADAHKGRFGDVLVVRGAPAMRGAATLALLGAQAVGAGRLHLGVDDDGGGDPMRPEAMTRRIDPASADPERALGPATAVVVGCGLGTGEAAAAKLAAAIAHPAALVIDADGLNAIAADPSRRTALVARSRAGRPTVLTPHPLEAARLLGCGTGDVQRDRIVAAHRLATATGTCVVLKGAGTVVALPDGRWTVNASGGPILSVAGTGDVLAGVVAGLLAAGLAPFVAAVLGAWLHGAAADALAAADDRAAGIGLAAPELAAAIRATANRLAAGR
ncbi:MAG TPA: NAD(P)H-hydrate dehydratase [Burkholderiaceae bacterium]|nr:NAD(P)H-hydrate dehydratase [Burkholderiaceae bacterium]